MVTNMHIGLEKLLGDSQADLGMLRAAVQMLERERFEVEVGRTIGAKLRERIP